MSHATDHPTTCSGKKCTASVPGAKWARIKATKQGWIFLKNGESYCPEHLPEWVEGWRLRRAAREGKLAPKCGMKTDS